jgi:hypothetical protein
MVNGKKVTISIIAVMIALNFYVKYSYSQDKPSEEEIKGIIMTIELVNDINNKALSNLLFDTFQITNEFISKEKGGGGESSPYCIEVNYIIKYNITKNIVDEKKSQLIILNLYLKGITNTKQEIDSFNKEIEETKQRPDIEVTKKEIVRDDARYYFVKKGNKWYGSKGWR